MKRYFFDTSALVKIYHREDGSDFCLELYANHSQIIISELARVELYSAVYRKQSEKQLSVKALNSVLKMFKQDCEGRYEVLQIASLIYEEACSLLSRYSNPYGLRTLDSLQLATFLNYCKKVMTFLSVPTKSLQRLWSVRVYRQFLFERRGRWDAKNWCYVPGISGEDDHGTIW